MSINLGAHHLQAALNEKNQQKHMASQIQMIQPMLHQVRSLTHHFLSQVAGVYKRNRIVFPVQQYFEMLIRILFPIQLQNIKNQSLLNSFLEQKRHEINKHYQQDQKDKHQRKQSIRQSKQDFTKQESIKKTYPQSEIGDSQSLQGSYRLEYESDMRKGRHTIRSRGLEEQINMWIINEIQSGGVVTKKSIMAKARQMGKEYQFKACPRWCDNFLNRNPSIKAMIYKRLREAQMNRKQLLRKTIPQTKSPQDYMQDGISQVAAQNQKLESQNIKQLALKVRQSLNNKHRYSQDKQPYFERRNYGNSYLSYQNIRQSESQNLALGKNFKLDSDASDYDVFEEDV